MSQRRPNVLVFVNSNSKPPNSPHSKLDSVKCRMLHVDSSPLPSLARKAARLHVLRPAAADLLEQLVDDLLLEVT